jgi:hypothetical protein
LLPSKNGNRPAEFSNKDESNFIVLVLAVAQATSTAAYAAVAGAVAVTYGRIQSLAVVVGVAVPPVL